MAQTTLDIAQRFTQLPPEKRRGFLEALAARGLPFTRLPIPPRAPDAVPVLSPAQRRLWTQAQLDPASAAYTMPGVFRLRGTLDIAALRAALDGLAARHAILRTVYRPDGAGGAHPHVQPPGPIAMDHSDLSNRPDAETTARAVAEDFVAQPFDLAAEAPLRAKLLRLAADEHWLVVALHHIAADGASLPLALADLAAGYAAARRGEPQAAAQAVQYADAVAWQAAWLDGGEADRQRDHWRARMADAPPPLALPADGDRTTATDTSQAGAECAVALPPALTHDLRCLARDGGHTLFTALLAAYAILLSRLTGQDDLIIGIPAAGRRQREAEGLIGCFVNTLPLRLRLDGRGGFTTLMAQAAAEVAAALDHQDLPLEDIAALAPAQECQPLVQVMFDHAPAPLGALAMDGLAVESLPLPVRTAKFDLALGSVERADGGILGRLAYRTGLLGPESAQGMVERWRALLAQAVAAPDRPIASLDPRTPAEVAAITAWHRDPAWALPPPPAVPLLIARHAVTRPDAPAVLFGDSVLTFGALNRRANRLARRLRALGAGPEARVGVCLNRTPDLIVTLLAVMKSGAAFVPLDPDYPPERLRAIRRGANLSLMVGAPLDGLPMLAGPDDGTAGLDDSDPGVTPHPRSLAYIIHTSGSTGVPKGVAVEHGALAMHCVATAALYDMTAGSRELHFLSFTFDGAQERWMTALTQGGSLVLRDDSLWTAEQTYEAIRRHGVTHAGFPPKYLQQLAAWAETQGDPPPVHLYSFGGEAMPRMGLQRLFAALRPRRAINGYGPTEAVVTPLVWKSDGATLPDTPYVPIGRPVGDRSAHILDGDLRPVPVGVTGELWIGGSGLARGYVGQPAATAARFIPDPFGDPGARLYRTGDLARWREDGTVEYLGRRDTQVKVRGFRVEPGEIEAQLIAQAGVHQAVVVADETGGITRLVGYVVPADGTTVDVASLTARLAEVLPAHMVPARLMLLPALPVTTAGKLDRAALPAPRWEADGQVPPRDACEAALARLWAETLGQASVGVTDNFFEIGGDSILALQIVARARAQGLRFTPKQLFDRQTIAALAPVVEEKGSAAPDLPVPDGPSPLTPIQSWFFSQPIPRRQRWNQSILLASDRPLDAEALAGALTVLGRHHDALRLRFHQDAGGAWWQSHAAQAVIPLDEVAAETTADITRLCDEAQDGLDLAHGPLMRARLIRLPDGGQRLFLVAHHLVVDGVSWRVLLDDLRALTTGPCQDRALPGRTTPYALWAGRLAGLAGAPATLAQLPRWRAALDTPPLPADRPGAPNTRRHAVTRTLRLDTATTQALLTTAPAAYRTRVDVLLLAALAEAVRRTWKRPAITVHLEGHGREPLFPELDLERTVGWFTSVYPVRLETTGGWDATIRQVKETLRAIPEGGIGFGLLRHLAPDAVTRDALAAPVSLSFNYLGQFDGALRDGPWRAAPEDCGAGTDPDAPLGALLSVDGQVLDGVLALYVRHSAALFREDTAAAFLAAYEDALASVVRHCLATVPGQATPSDFPLVGLTQAQLDTLPVPTPDIADILPATPLQAGMARHRRLHPDSDAYGVQVWALIDGLDPARMAAAWAAMTERCDILRAGFAWPGGDDPVLVVRRAVELDVQYLDWRGEADIDAAWNRHRDAEWRRGFVLERAPLMRLTLARTGDRQYRFLWTWHHALLDGWSMSRLLGDILRLYDGETPLPPTGRLRDVAAWKRRQDKGAADAFWRTELASLPAPTRVRDHLAPPAPAETDGAVEYELDENAVRRLNAVAAGERVTLNTLVQAGWLQVLSEVTGQATVAFGATMSGRSLDMPDIDSVMGLLAGTLPVVHALAAGEDRGTALRRLFEQNLRLRQFEHAPPPHLQSWNDPANAPFDSTLVFENYPVDEALRHEVRGDVRFSDVSNRGRLSYPLALVVVPRATLVLRLEYCGRTMGKRNARALVDSLAARVLALAAH
ncbi:non-ribosomal peptide synthase protein (TIGR01720 family)/amino acid adenylation domain-containing protein [Nitrospirillum amazonense]|uniref:Non-ribosomal peptide synthase protein (TIGR01720 family)/amino acid adenylation domain-containing protein n=1 Tax=Nitrospirillum amazonense TaxID=28077 RepID=A0A560EMX4_9PROT|nr:non-ribosomal peptide synthetase [Nitrospirillum amazonense]TWB10731.1 non-ribosomal peptide synthase protein (TIGR01720 family)/amino acid adenylation domain-containing protein [Nitrospirillum amazonense]